MNYWHVAWSRIQLNNEVSTGSGSDRVIVVANSTVAGIETRSLLLPVRTASSLDPLLGSDDFIDLAFQRRQRAQDLRIPAAIIMKDTLGLAVDPN